MNSAYGLLIATMITATFGGATFAVFWHHTLAPPEPVLFSPVSNFPTVRVEETELSVEHRPLNLLDVDEVQLGSEFDVFRRAFRQAVANRDQAFLTEILPPESPLWGILGEEESWQRLEKAIALGCVASEPSTIAISIEPPTEFWTCPAVKAEFSRKYRPPRSVADSLPARLNWEKNQVVVVGAKVNVRSQPYINSEVIAVISNEVLTLNPSPAEFSTNLFQSPLEGWTPVLLPNQKPGYIYNRYVYSPLTPQLQFGQIQGKWQLFYFAEPPTPNIE